MNSAQFGIAIATASPRTSPAARSPCAIWFCSANSSPRVHSRPSGATSASFEGSRCAKFQNPHVGHR